MGTLVWNGEMAACGTNGEEFRAYPFTEKYCTK